MPNNNEIDITLPLTVPNGGTENTILTLDGVLYGNGTGAVGITSAGSNGQVLTSNGGGASAPTFQNAPTVAGNMTLISSQTLSGSTTGAVFTGLTNTYKTYFLTWYNISTTNGGAISSFAGIQVSVNNGSTFINTGYDAMATSMNHLNDGFSPEEFNTEFFFIPGTAGSSFGLGYYWIYNIGVSGQNANLIGASWSGANYRLNGLSYQSNVNALRVAPLQGNGTLSGGTISGTVRLYGLAS